MRALQFTVNQVLNTDNNGTRTLVRDENTLLLYDNVAERDAAHPRALPTYRNKRAAVRR